MLYEMKAISRKVKGKNLESARKNGQVPGIIYGPGTPEGVMVFVNAIEFSKIYDKAGESAIVNLAIEGEAKARGTIIKDIDFDPLKGFVRHVDFYQFKEGQKLDLEMEINFVGEAPAVKELGAIVIKNLNALKIRCLPQDIISSIDVNLSGLKAFGDKIKVKDLQLPSQIEVLNELDTVVVIVTEPEAEEVAPVKAATETVAAPVAGAAPAAAAPAAEAKKPAKK